MALKGNLRDFSTTQLFNLVNLARKTGTLTIEGQGSTVHICFKEGKLVYASADGQGGHLAQILQRANKLTGEQARIIRERASTKDDKALAVMLMQAGYVTQNDIIKSVREYTLEIVYKLFGWSDGIFRFEPTLAPAQDRITVPIDLENVIMEGSRRIKEYERLMEELPDLDMALRFTDRPDARLRNISLSVEEWRVISFINPRNTIRQIAQSNNMSEFQIRKIVYGMLQAGLVMLVEPEGRPKPAAAPAKPGAVPGRAAAATPAVKRSVVTRLIDRIKQL